MDAENIKYYLEAVAAARELYAQAVVEQQNASDVISATPEYAAWAAADDRAVTCKGIRDAAEADAKAAMLAIYTDSGETSAAPGAKVKLYTKHDYDPNVAILWAVGRQLLTALNLNKRGFEAAIKVLEPRFVTTTKEPRATMARDLSQYLED